MAKKSPTLDWCTVRLGEDMNWWVAEISDPVHWDVDSLGILDPRQIGHVIDLCDALRDYGFDPEIIERAFYSFAIDRELKENRVRLHRVRESFLEGEVQLFALPDILDEERGPYADFLDQITKARVKMLNDLIDFEQNLTIEELEDEIRERQSAEFFEGRAVHFFNEITAILEYVPNGYELEIDEESPARAGTEEDLGDLPDFEEEEENIEEDETMKWDEEEEEKEDREFSEDDSEEGENPPAADEAEKEDWSESEEEEEEAEEGEEGAPRRRSRPKRR